MAQFMRRLLLLCFSVVVSSAFGQQPTKVPNEQHLPVATQWLLDAAGPTQRSAIGSVYLVVCPRTNKKGTAFLIKSGIIVTDNHVVEGCESGDLTATSSSGESISFSKMITDPTRDLALLRPVRRITGGFALGNEQDLKTGETVTTWGFPLIYNGPAPLLSVGYLSGFEAIQQGDKSVKHLVVNGAFNPGNSGGPLLLSGQGTVVGIVVWKMRILAPAVQTLITGLSKSGAMMSSGVSQRQPDGTMRQLGQHEVTALVLQEFYNTVQVMIGEAISVSELKDFLREKENDLK